ncbi:hypothetical protein A6X21_09810 [Planctopirus hydrillae]|uniref:Transposase IS4-like domain-containing protein n=1 Tax=Planctopirus hydrillae TaxID=1841610 RepID=A0A1C3E7A1_9PLAN|nr:hypothetical protein A6X21_09810 [Planctopirus hydrillae]
MAKLTAVIQEVTHEQVTVAYVDQGDTGDQPRNDASENGIQLEVVKHTEAKKGFVLLPRRWVVERTFAWLGRSRRLTRDDERLTKVVAGWHWVAMMSLLIKYIPEIIQNSP